MPQESQKVPSTSPLKKPKKKSKKKSKGIGDSIEKITKATGVKAIVEAVAGKDCGCNKRKEWLNKKFPYAKQMSESDKSIWTNTLQPALNRNRLLNGEMAHLIEMYQRVFGIRKKKSRCGSCMLTLMKELEKVYEASCDE